MNREPARPHTDLLARFRLKIGANADSWLGFLHERPVESPELVAEFANLSKAAGQALLEPLAWNAGLALVTAMWPFVERRGYWLEWRELLQQALHVSRAIRQPLVEALVLDQCGELARTLAEYAGARDYQEAALAIYRRLGDTAGIGRVLSHLSQAYLRLGDHENADRCCHEAVACLQQIGDTAELGIAYNNWAIICATRDQFEAALERYARAMDLMIVSGNRRGQAKVCSNQGEVFRRLNRFEEAEACYEQAVAFYQEIGDDILVAHARSNLCIVLHVSGQTEMALAINRELGPLFRRLGNRPKLANTFNNDGVFLAALGRHGAAGQAYEQAVEIYLELEDRVNAASSLTNWAEGLLDESRVGAANECLDRAGALLGSVISPPAWVMQNYDALRQRAMTQNRPA